MELIEDNHRVELRVYQQKVRHLEYDHRNNLKSIVDEGKELLEVENVKHEENERNLLKLKEKLKFEQMQLEIVNAKKVAEVKQQHEKQLIKLRQQFEDGLTELINRCKSRLTKLTNDLELRRKVEIHEVEERKNKHINDLILNHNIAFKQMKTYYIDITSGNLKLIKNLQKQVEELKERSLHNKKLLNEYIVENQKLSDPLTKVSNEISELQLLLKERVKDQMALKNANSRLISLQKSSNLMTQKLNLLEEEYKAVERERDFYFNTYDETIQKVKNQSDFYNQALEQKLIAAEMNVEKSAQQVEEIISAAKLDSNEVARMMTSLNHMLTAKDNMLNQLKFDIVKLQKSYNDSLGTYQSKMKELGIPADDPLMLEINNTLEVLPLGTSSAPVPSLIVKM